jgi:hypothetical protein
VTWTTAKDGPQSFTFRGGVVMIANTPLAEMAELKALATRISVCRLEVADSEIVALMRQLAGQGHQTRNGKLSPTTCLEIAEFVINQCSLANQPLDMRLYVNSLADYLQWQDRHSQSHWHTLVANRVRQSAAHRQEEIARQSRQEGLELQRTIFRQIREETSHFEGATQNWEQLKRFTEKTGKRQATFYRRKAEVEEQDRRRQANRDNEDT